ncbi:uncharacterized protein [Littorina saxatilis]|uniref:Poly [ADP-ribose] polymerase n=1 Tax=Littorina saxatilis TaxID=31220 RepID=A0AAN9B2E3_9CAEN
MAGTNELWRRKMVVRNIPGDWSQDMLVNFIEVATEADIADEEAGVEFFSGISHTALLTFAQPLTDLHIQNAESNCQTQRFPLKFLLVKSQPSSVVVRGVNSSVSSDNLLFYFESAEAGGGEEEVTECTIHDEWGMAVVTFASTEAAAGVLAVKEHTPCRGTTVRVEPCYEQFHGQLLRDNTPPQPSPHRVTSQDPVVRKKDSSSVWSAAAGEVSPRDQATPYHHSASKGDPVKKKENRDGVRSKPYSQSGARHGPTVGTKDKEGIWNDNGRHAFLNDCASPYFSRSSGQDSVVGKEDSRGSICSTHGRYGEVSVGDNATPYSQDATSGREDGSGVRNLDEGEVCLEDVALDFVRNRQPNPGLNHQGRDKRAELWPSFESLSPRADDCSDQLGFGRSKTKTFETPDADFAISHFHDVDPFRGTAGQSSACGQSTLSRQNFQDKKIATAKEGSDLDNNKELEWLRLKLMETEKENQRMLEQQRLTLMETEKEKHRMLEQQNKPSSPLKICTEIFPAYKLCLMHTFVDKETSSYGEVQIRESEGVVKFCCSQEMYDKFLLQLQCVEEETLPVLPAVTMILQTPAGKKYLQQLCPPSCSCDLQESTIVCATLSSDVTTAQRFLARMKATLKSLKVNGCAASQLQTFKQQLEQKFSLLHVTLPSGDADPVTVHCFSKDFDQVKAEVKDYLSRYKVFTNRFTLSGQEDRACRQWYTQNLDEMKNLIWKNGGEVTSMDDPASGGFTLMYQCHKDVSEKVQKMVQAIKKKTQVVAVDLESEFKSYTEQSLVINGLHNAEDTEFWCRQMEKKIGKRGLETVLSLTALPPKRKLPKLKYTRQAKQTKRPDSSRQPRQRPRVEQQQRTKPSGRQHRPNHHRHRDSVRPFEVNVGNCKLSVKTGNIAWEKADGVVCVVGEDMDLTKTAVGQAIVKQFPQATSALSRVAGRQQRAAGSVVSLAVPQAQSGSVTSLYVAVLSRGLRANLEDVVQGMVQQCLQLAVKYGNKSVAFPPLGVGRMFQFPEDTIAQAMVSAVRQFLQNSPGSLQSVRFVMYDANIARKFRETASKIGVQPRGLSVLDSDSESASSDVDNNGNSNDDDDDDDGKDLWGGRDDDTASSDSGDSDEDEVVFEIDVTDDEQASAVPPQTQPVQKSSSGRLQAHVCLKNQQDLTAVKAALREELRSEFLCEEISVEDLRTFKKLDPKSMGEIQAAADEKDVVLSIQTRGTGEVLVIRGHRLGMMEVSGIIRIKIHELMIQPAKGEERERPRYSRGSRSSGRTPEAEKMELPNYWSISQDGVFQNLENFVRDHRKFGKLHTVKDERGTEFSDITRLVRKTWDKRLVGAGKDASNLKHKDIQVVKVERLENPELWETYRTHRQHLLVRSKQDTKGHGFNPVEKAKGSTGPVKTTSLLSGRRGLSRCVESKVNEHYLFHGTKKEFIEKIIHGGLDSRLADHNAMLGQGIYTTESSTKADQYTDSKKQRTSGKKTMILMRVLLGDPYISKAFNPTKFRRPPCKRCYKDVCTCKNGTNFDSAIDDAGRNFREFVIYDRCSCYPEYFITYKRVG